MNKERLLAVADRIEQKPRQFNMGSFYYVPEYDNRHASFAEWDRAFLAREFRCGTMACVAGHAVMMYASDAELLALVDSGIGGGWNTLAARLLDLDPDHVSLFYWSPPGKALNEVTAAEAVAHIREFTANHVEEYA